MPRNQASETAKKTVRERVQGNTGILSPANSRQKDWLVSSDGRTSIFMTYAQTSYLFYDVSRDNLEKWLTYDASFVIFIAGSTEQVYIVPVHDLNSAISQVGLIAASDKAFKLHLLMETHMFRELEGLRLKPYLNAYNLLTGSESPASTTDSPLSMEVWSGKSKRMMVDKLLVPDETVEEHMSVMETLVGSIPLDKNSDHEGFTMPIDTELDSDGGHSRIAIARDMAQQILVLAHRQGVSPSTLINLWLQEKLLQIK